MEELELDRINANSPYIVELDFFNGIIQVCKRLWSKF